MQTKRPKIRIQNLHADEETRVAWILWWLSLSAIVFLLGIGLKAWFSGHRTYGDSLFLFALLVLGNLAVYRRTGNRSGHKWGLLTIVAVLFGYLVADGGEGGTGPLWFYVFPPLVFYLTGMRVGLMLAGICVCFAGIVFQFPHLPFVRAHYSGDFQLRFIATLVFETIFCFILEYSRRDARNDLVEMARLYERAARTDELTELPNRRDMSQHLNQEFSRYERSGNHFSIILIDLDHFKRVNDAFGHDAGDYVLTEFSSLLRATCRQSDFPSRWGGEEFLLLLPDTALLQALVMAERLRRQVESHDFTHKGQHIDMTMSAGICSISQTQSVEQLLKQADINLYQAKMKGRNQIVPRVRRPPENESSGADAATARDAQPPKPEPE